MARYPMVLFILSVHADGCEEFVRVCAHERALDWNPEADSSCQASSAFRPRLLCRVAR